ncbi:MAG TPA: hypothetical protein VFN23_07055 [Ktedonobacteraceae bacterium]|nr:hypothetical protein [Ktedonobacteraceae bacterium]
MNWLSVVTTLFDLLWLLAVLILLYLIWRSSEARLKHVTEMEKTLIEVSRKNADTTMLAVQQVQILVDVLKKMTEEKHVVQQPE